MPKASSKHTEVPNIHDIGHEPLQPDMEVGKLAGAELVGPHVLQHKIGRRLFRNRGPAAEIGLYSDSPAVSIPIGIGLVHGRKPFSLLEFVKEEEEIIRRWRVRWGTMPQICVDDGKQKAR